MKIIIIMNIIIINTILNSFITIINNVILFLIDINVNTNILINIIHYVLMSIINSYSY